MSVNLVKQWFPQLLTALDRAPMAGLICAAAILFGVTLAWTRSAAMPNTGKTALGNEHVEPMPTIPGKNYRAMIRKSAFARGVKSSTKLVIFMQPAIAWPLCRPIINAAFIALENRNLERVAQAIAENAKQLEWIVSGTISEYRGENFLLVNRAELKSRIRSSDAAQ